MLVVVVPASTERVRVVFEATYPTGDTAPGRVTARKIWWG